MLLACRDAFLLSLLLWAAPLCAVGQSCLHVGFSPLLLPSAASALSLQLLLLHPRLPPGRRLFWLRASRLLPTPFSSLQPALSPPCGRAAAFPGSRGALLWLPDLDPGMASVVFSFSVLYCCVCRPAIFRFCDAAKTLVQFACSRGPFRCVQVLLWRRKCRNRSAAKSSIRGRLWRQGHPFHSWSYQKEDLRRAFCFRQDSLIVLHVLRELQPRCLVKHQIGATATCSKHTWRESRAWSENTPVPSCIPASC